MRGRETHLQMRKLTLSESMNSLVTILGRARGLVAAGGAEGSRSVGDFKIRI